MTKKRSTKEQIKDLIVEKVKDQEPETTEQLMRTVQQITGSSHKEITELLIELENEDKVSFIDKESATPALLKPYVFSSLSAWYWATIVLVAGAATTILTIPDNIYPLIYFRAVLGMIFILFLPGFALIKTLWPGTLPIEANSKNMDMIERIALSIGTSIILTFLVGLLLNYAPWGIGLIPVTLSLIILTLALATVALFFEHKTKTELVMDKVDGRRPKVADGTNG